jgi:radical SAM-linked protein
MSFAPALSLGVSSLCEIVDLKIAADVDAASLVDALSEGSQEGMRFLDGTRLGIKDAGVSRIIDAASYVVAIPRSVLAGRGEAWLAERVEAVRAATELPIVRRIDGIGKKVDVRAFLRAIRVGDERAERAVERAGIIGDLATIEVDVEIRGSGSVKIAEVVEVLRGVGEPELPHRAVRVAMGMYKDGAIASPMQLEAVRKGEPPAVRCAE